jgi:hypothetical protein
MRGAGTLSLAEALRDRAWRTARAEAYRFQVAMGFLGFIGGLVLVVPAVLWLASIRHPEGGLLARRMPAVFADAVSASASRAPALVSAPTLAGRELQALPAEVAPAVLEFAPKPPAGEHLQSIEAVRELIRSGQVHAAREMLVRPELAETGEAAFMMAETYDPNVLAALGITSVQAEAEIARHHYEVALAKGVAAAAQRLEALE